MKAIVTILMLGTLMMSCASHGTWSKSDRGAWANLDELIGSHEKNYYVELWGNPVSRRDAKLSDESENVTIIGEELLWLWKPDGTGPSAAPGQGWELFLKFNEQEELRSWRVGRYQTFLTVGDVIAASREFNYNLILLLDNLGFSAVQHEIGGGPRQSELLKIQNTLIALSQATLEADTQERALHDRLATEQEVLQVATRQAAVSSRYSEPARRKHSPNYENGVAGGGFIGQGFLGPYTPNAYGPGMNMDATGRPFIWRPDFGGPALGPIQPNVYGPGVGMDATGRPVRPACPPGWAGPC